MDAHSLSWHPTGLAPVKALYTLRIERGYFLQQATPYFAPDRYVFIPPSSQANACMSLGSSYPRITAGSFSTIILFAKAHLMKSLMMSLRISVSSH